MCEMLGTQRQNHTGPMLILHKEEIKPCKVTRWRAVVLLGQWGWSAMGVPVFLLEKEWIWFTESFNAKGGNCGLGLNQCYWGLERQTNT